MSHSTVAAAAVARPSETLLPSSGRLPSLDGLRATSIAIVVLAHLVSTGVVPLRAVGKAVFETVTAGGELGVSFFFVISGLLITHLLLREQSRHGAISVRSFYYRRAFRILPAAYLYIGAVWLLSHLGVFEVRPAEFRSALFFYWDYARSSNGLMLFHLWSLSIEEQFYLLWPWLIVLCGSRQRLVKVCVWAFCVWPLVRVVGYFVLPGLRSRATYLFHVRADLLICGGLLAALGSDPKGSAILKRCLRYRPHVWGGVYLFGLEPLLMYCFGARFSFPIGYSLEAVAIGAIALWAITAWDRQWLARLLNLRVVAHLGAISYSLYLWQQLVIFRGAQYGLRWTIPLLIVAAAELSYWGIEQPFLRLRARLGLG